MDGDLFEGVLSVEEVDRDAIVDGLRRSSGDPAIREAALERPEAGSFVVSVAGTPLVFDRADFEPASADDDVLELRAAGTTVRLADLSPRPSRGQTLVRLRTRV